MAKTGNTETDVQNSYIDSPTRGGDATAVEVVVSQTVGGGGTENIIDAGNSTIIALGIGTTFTGAWIDATLYTSAYVQIFSDEDSADLGVQLQTSIDGINPDHVHSYDYDSSNNEAFHYEGRVPAKFFRLVYVNGGTAQTVLRIQTKLSISGGLDHVHPLDYSIGLTHPAALNRSVITGQNSSGGGSFVNVKVNPSGSLTVEANQDNHDDLNLNANIQQNDTDISDNNPLSVSDILDSMIDTGNSTIATLAPGATFTGVFFDVLLFSAVSVILTSDEDSATNGIKIQFSTNGTDVDDESTFTLDVSENATRRFQFGTSARFFRFVYVNGGTVQGFFRAQTLCHVQNILTSIHKIDDPIVGDRSSLLVKSVIAGETTAGGGGFVNVKVNPSGALEVNASQDTHDDLNVNANIQIGDVDVGGGNPVPISAASLPLPTGASTSANQLADGHNVAITGDVEVVQPTPSDLKAQVEGTTSVGATVPKPIGIGGRDLSNNLQHYTSFPAGGLFVMATILTDTLGTNVMDMTGGAGSIKGNVAHSAVDTQHPVKIGGRAIADVYSETAVSSNDRTDGLFSLAGQQHTLNYGHRSGAIADTLLEIRYDDSPTFAVGTDIDPKGYRTGTVLIDIEATLSPTRIQIRLEIKSGSGAYHEAGSGYWQAVYWEDGYLNTQRFLHLNFKVPETTFRFHVIGTGTDATNYFEITDFEIHMRS